MCNQNRLQLIVRLRWHEGIAKQLTLTMPLTNAIRDCLISPIVVMLKRRYCMNPPGAECVWVAHNKTFS